MTEGRLGDQELNWREQYAEARRVASEQQLWQLPAMSLTAQSFLYSQGVAHGTEAPARILVAVVGLFTAGVTALLVVHRAGRGEMWREILDGSRASRGAAPLRRTHMLDAVMDFAPYRGRFVKRMSRLVPVRFALRGPSPADLWLTVLAVFALADLFVLGVGVTEAANLWDPF